MMKRLLSRHRESGLAAAGNYVALFAGERSRDAMVAATRLDLFVETVIALGKSLGKARR